MKILYILDGLRSGGKERRAYSLMERLCQYEHITFEIILLNKDVHFKNVFDLGVNVHVLDRNNLSKFETIKRLRKIKLNFSPDLIHVWDTLSTIYAIPLTIFNKTKLITSKISDAPPGYKRFSTFGLLSELCFYFSDFILANSYAGIEVYKVSNNKSKVIYNGFDFLRLKDLKHKEQFKNEISCGKDFIITMVASFSDKKDYKTYLDTARQLLQNRNDVIFLCVGDGVFREKYQKLYRHDSILFLGKRNDVESIVNISDVGVLLSTQGEGISNALLEFMAIGKPVVASNFNGNKELVSDGLSGIILNSNNSQELFEALNKLLSSKKMRVEMGNNGRERVNKMFSIEKMIEEFIRTYKLVLEK